MSEIKVLDEGSGNRRWCRHYKGMHGKTACDAGVEFASVRVDHEPIQYRRRGEGAVYTASRSFPCVAGLNYVDCGCQQREYYTAAEIEEHERDVHDSFDRSEKAVKAIRDFAKGRKGINGEIECPNCKGKLKFSIASYNGHIHARCSTDDCVSFMQ